MDAIDLDGRDGESGYVSGAGIITKQRVGDTGQIQSVQVGQILELDYRLDSAGRIVGITENGQAQSYAYGHDGLVPADTLEGTFAFGYDTVGNRTSKRVWQNNQQFEDESYHYAKPGEGNRLLEQRNALTGEARATSYSATGAPTTRGVMRYEYDAKDQPIALYLND